MALAPGSRLGVYEVTEQIGAGGMGEVYRATDSNLKRSVAIKVLPASVAGDADRLARFQREAEVLAALNHPNIGAIYGLERTPDFTALVMELVEGEDLSQRLARGAIRLDEALPIAKQIAEALEAAHEQGIIHRDLKPANIKVRPDGTVKVLDFGLAKAIEPAAGSSPGVSMSPTITTPAMMTGVGMILGTVAYMSPEQARGKAVDKRADIWAFGCVLFEMLSGRQTFEAGETVSDAVAAILKNDPDWSALPADTPPYVRRLLRRCLQKGPQQRMPHIGIARIEIEEGPSESIVPHGTAPIAPARRLRRALPFVVTALIVSALTAVAVWKVRSSAAATVMRFSVDLPEGQQWSGASRSIIAISPDGTNIVYATNQRLYLRSLSDFNVRPIADAGNEATGQVNPVFSPDGQSIAYFETGDTRAIRRVALSGGAPVTVCQADNPFGMSWTGDTIFFSQGNQGIMRVSATGGKPEQVATVKQGELAYGPQLLPDGQTLLFTLATGANVDRWDKARIVAESLQSHERKTVIEGGSDARYSPTGHLVYALSGVVFAVPFDVKRVVQIGSAVPMVEGVTRSLAGGTAAAQFSMSNSGSLAYIPGPVSATGRLVSLGLFDRNGGSDLLKIQPGPYQLPRLSPDGKYIAFGSDAGKVASIYVYELSGTSSMRRLTFEGEGHNRFPIWSADGQRLAFQSDRDGDLGIFWQRADGSGAAERLTKAEAETSHIPESWAPDGERFLYNFAKGGANSLRVFSLKSKTDARFDGVEFTGPALSSATFSPDGRWVAYSSRDRRSTSAVYVQPFPPTGEKYQISKNAEDGHHALWSPDGAELFFHPGPVARLHAVRISTQPSFTVGEAIPVAMPFQSAPPNAERPFDISRDGQHFLGLIDAAATSGTLVAPQIHVVLNWFEELKARVPRK